jgi:hypothetical protein
MLKNNKLFVIATLKRGKKSAGTTAERILNSEDGT